MRTHRSPVAFAIVAIALVFPRGGAAAGATLIQGLQVRFADPMVDPQAARVHRLATTATSYLGQRLVSEINTTLKKGPPEDAVATAHLRRVSADGASIPGMPAITAFKLTSQRLLNVANGPDFAEEQALDEIARTLRTATRPPELLVQHIRRPDGTEEWRGYRPIALLPMCTACHGPTDSQSPRLRTLLIERASASAAVDYKPGEWRGLLRVTVEPPPEP